MYLHSQYTYRIYLTHIKMWTHIQGERACAYTILALNTIVQKDFAEQIKIIIIKKSSSDTVKLSSQHYIPQITERILLLVCPCAINFKDHAMCDK